MEQVSLYCPEQLHYISEQQYAKVPDEGNHLITGWLEIAAFTRKQTFASTPEEVIDRHDAILGINKLLESKAYPNLPAEGQLLRATADILKIGVGYANTLNIDPKVTEAEIIFNIGNDACSSEAIAQAVSSRHGLPLNLGSYHTAVNDILREISLPGVDLKNTSNKLFNAYNKCISMPFCIWRGIKNG